MNYIQLGGVDLKASRLAIGCMRIANKSVEEVSEIIETSLEQGINFFDHADIYGGGKSEEIFGAAVKNIKLAREKYIIQSKCGICSGYYDFSKEHIIDSVNKSLKRLNTDYLDVLLLHRPDTLMEEDEIADAFKLLKQSGKVLHFGVSNQKPAQIELIEQYTGYRMVANQLQFSCAHTGIIDQGLNVNIINENSLDRDNSILEYCRLKKITIQTWSSLQYGFFEGTFLDNPQYEQLNSTLRKIGEKYGITPGAIAVAWILRHPAGMQVIIGTTRPDRIKEMVKAADITLTRQEWYEIYLAAGNKLP